MEAQNFGDFQSYRSTVRAITFINNRVGNAVIQRKQLCPELQFVSHVVLRLIIAKKYWHKDPSASSLIIKFGSSCPKRVVSQDTCALDLQSTGTFAVDVVQLCWVMAVGGFINEANLDY